MALVEKVHFYPTRSPLSELFPSKQTNYSFNGCQYAAPFLNEFAAKPGAKQNCFYARHSRFTCYPGSLLLAETVG